MFVILISFIAGIVVLYFVIFFAVRNGNEKNEKETQAILNAILVKLGGTQLVIKPQHENWASNDNEVRTIINNAKKGLISADRYNSLMDNYREKTYSANLNKSKK